MDTLLLSKLDAAKILGISIRSLENLIAQGTISVRRIGRRVLITRSELESFAQNNDSTRRICSYGGVD